jgi:uroporphyrinogen-III decarboxylase
MDFKKEYQFEKHQILRFKSIYRKYREMYENPDNCEPMFIVNTPVEGIPTWEERLADPLVMLKAELDLLKPHMEIEDDRVPTVRVQFGTAQVAAAFGCEMYTPENNLPCAGSHVLKNAGDVYELEKPSLEAGWYGKLKEWTKIYQQNLPEGVQIQHPDIQSAFNSAHLIRGNDILTDFYDDPEAVDALLDVVTDYMIDLVSWLKDMISHDREYFFDWGAMWKGTARISNCSMHMISPEMYFEHVLPRDMRFMKAIGGGRIHYCGSYDEVIDEFFKNPYVSGLDYDSKYHDLWDLSKRAPKNLVLLDGCYSANDKEKYLERLEREGWPKKNIIICMNATSVEEGKILLERFKNTI